MLRQNKPLQKCAPLKLRPSTRRFIRFWANLPYTYPGTPARLPGRNSQRHAIQGISAGRGYPEPFDFSPRWLQGKPSRAGYPRTGSHLKAWFQGRLSRRHYPTPLFRRPPDGQSCRRSYPVWSVRLCRRHEDFLCLCAERAYPGTTLQLLTNTSARLPCTH